MHTWVSLLLVRLPCTLPDLRPPLSAPVSTCHPCSNDIVSLQIYIASGASPVDNTANSRNLTIYISPTTVYRNGSLCVANYTTSRTDAVPNNVTCAVTLSNAKFVTIERFISSGAPSLSLYEVQILRSGEAWQWFAVQILRSRSCAQDVACGMGVSSVARLAQGRLPAWTPFIAQAVMHLRALPRKTCKPRMWP